MKFTRGFAFVVLFAFAVSFVHAGPASAQKAQPVTSRVLTVAAGAPVLYSDAAASGKDSYVTSRKAGTTSQFMSDGEWNVVSGPTRAFWLNLGPASPFAGQYVHATIFTYCGNYGDRPVASLRGVNDSTTCAMLFRIGGPENPTFYRLAFNSSKRPGASDVTFTCTKVKSATDASCIGWSARPADNDYTIGDGRGTARLYKVTSSTGSTPEVEEEVGDYAVAFECSITSP